MAIGIGGPTSTQTTNRTDPATGAAHDPNAPAESQVEPTDGIDEGPPPGEEWTEFTDTPQPGLGGSVPPDTSSTTLAASPEIAAGSDLGSLSTTEPVDAAEPAPVDAIVDEAALAESPDQVDAIIAREAENLGTVYGSLEGMTEEERLTTIGELSQLSELAGVEGQTALAQGLVGAMDLENTNAEINSGIVRGLENAVYEGDGATLSVNVASDLMTRPELGAYDLGTRTALGTTNAMSVLRYDLETSTAEYQGALSAIDQQIQSEGLTGEEAAVRYQELAASPEMQALDASLFAASERYRSVIPGAQAALASESINWSGSSFVAGLRDESAKATDPALLGQADAMRTGVGTALAAGGIVAPGTLGIPPGAPPPRMADRHILDNMNFWKGAESNSYLLTRPTDAELHSLYGEAWGKLSGNTGEVTLSNGQTWHLNKADGKFYPVEGPGITKLSQQEVSFLRTMTKQIRGGTAPAEALANMGRGMGPQQYTVTPAMESTLQSLGQRLGYSSDELGRAIAPHLPPSATAAVPAEASAAAAELASGRPTRFVQWGGRLLLVVGLAADAYEVYTAENKPKTLVTKAGAWGGSLAAAGGAAQVAAPLAAGGPIGVGAYGLIVLGSGIGGYIVGGEVAETIYEWTFE